MLDVEYRGERQSLRFSIRPDLKRDIVWRKKSSISVERKP